MIKEFDKVWEEWNIPNWDEHCSIIHGLNLYDDEENKERIKELCEKIYACGFHDGYTDAKHNYYRYHSNLCDTLQKFFKEIVNLNNGNKIKGLGLVVFKFMNEILNNKMDSNG